MSCILSSAARHAGRASWQGKRPPIYKCLYCRPRKRRRHTRHRSAATVQPYVQAIDLHQAGMRRNNPTCPGQTRVLQTRAVCPMYQHVKSPAANRRHRSPQAHKHLLYTRCRRITWVRARLLPCTQTAGWCVLDKARQQGHTTQSGRQSGEFEI
jgi:hypothetical protein